MPFELDITESEIYKMGQVQEARQILLLLLEGRFGPVNRSFQKRINEGNQDQIRRWIKQSSDAHKLADVFQVK